MNCQAASDRLGEYLDGELTDELRAQVQVHLDGCDACRQELARLQTLVADLQAEPVPSAPPELWTVIERRLSGGIHPVGAGLYPPGAALAEQVRPGDLAEAQHGGIAPVRRLFRRPLALAAGFVLLVGLTWSVVRFWPEAPAAAGSVDFAPLLDRIDDGLAAGLDALKQKYHGRPTTLADAARTVRLRLAPEPTLPGGLVLKSASFIHFGPKPSLALYFAGPAGELLVMQCPPNMKKQYGARDCLACSVGSKPGVEVRHGPWRLTHFEGRNCCICIVTTLDSEALQPVLTALHIEQ